MIVGITRGARAALISVLGAAALIGSGAAPAQVQPVDPDRAIDGDLSAPKGSPSPAPSPQPTITASSVSEAPEPVPGASEAAAAPAAPASTFVLVYNLYDTESLYRKRFAAGEGQAYLVGGFNVAYLRKGDVVLIPIRVGAGLRLGVNAGYMKFSKKQTWLPF